MADKLSGSQDPKLYPVKVTVTFMDGHTQDYDTFILAIGNKLVMTGTLQGHISYTMSKASYFDCITRLCGDMTVLEQAWIAVLTSLRELLHSLPPQQMIHLIQAINQFIIYDTPVDTLFKVEATEYPQHKVGDN